MGAGVVARALQAAKLRPQLSPAARAWIDELSPVEIASWFIGGIAYDELPFATEGLAGLVGDGDGVISAPRRFRPWLWC